MDAIFLSYRRDDTEGQAGRLFEDLRQAFGADKVFMDVATIEPGVDFRRAIEKSTAQCSVLLALIGRGWLTAAGPDGRRRLDDANDFVRVETAAALKRDIVVIPVLVQGARMPHSEELPEDLRDLAFRNSVELTHARWDSDVQLLIKALRPHVMKAAAPAPSPSAAPTPSTAAPSPQAPEPRPQPPAPTRPAWLLPAGVGAAVVVGLVFGWTSWSGTAEKPGESRVAIEAASARQAEQARISAEKAAAEKSAQQAAEQEAARKAAAEKAAAEGAAAEKAAAEKAAVEKAAVEKAAAERARAEKEAAARAAARKAAAEKAAAETAAAERAAAEKAAAERAAAEKAAADRAAAERAAAEREATERAAAERAARDAAAREQSEQKRRLRQAQVDQHRAGVCISGYVWRDARPGDKVCVTPQMRGITARENSEAAMRRQPGGGAYGPATCLQGYVWREAYQGDVVCVTPMSRQQNAAANAAAASRVVPMPQ